jgi:hypothetical protein
MDCGSQKYTCRRDWWSCYDADLRNSSLFLVSLGRSTLISASQWGTRAPLRFLSRRANIKNGISNFDQQVLNNFNSPTQTSA